MNIDDRYAKIREALEMRPTPGPWDIWVEPVRDRHEAIAELTEQVENTDPFVGKLFLLNAGGKCPATTGCGSNSEANAAYIAACDPDTIRELLAERDALAAEVERVRDGNRYAHLEQIAIKRAEKAEATIKVQDEQLLALRKWRQEYVGKLTIAEAALAEKDKEIAALREAAREAVNCLTHHAEDNENTRWVLSLLNAALKEAYDGRA